MHWLQMRSPVCQNYARSPPLVLKTQHYSTLLQPNLSEMPFQSLQIEKNRSQIYKPNNNISLNEIYRRKKKVFSPLTFCTTMLCYTTCLPNSVSFFSTFRIHKQLPLHTFLTVFQKSKDQH